jgi:hypothetical protein
MSFPAARSAEEDIERKPNFRNFAAHPPGGHGSSFEGVLRGASGSYIFRMATRKGDRMSNPDTRPWTYESVQELITLAREGVPDNVIAMKMKRPLADIHGKLSELGLSARTGE